LERLAESRELLGIDEDPPGIDRLLGAGRTPEDGRAAARAPPAGEPPATGRPSANLGRQRAEVCAELATAERALRHEAADGGHAAKARRGSDLVSPLFDHRPSWVARKLNPEPLRLERHSYL